MNATEVQTLHIMLDWKKRSLEQIVQDFSAGGKRASEITIRRALKKLMDHHLLERSDGSYALSYKNPKALLMKRLSAGFDLAKILLDSNELVFKALSGPRTVTQLIRSTKLSEATVFRSVEDLMEAGAVRREDGLYKLATDELLQLSKMLYEEDVRKRIEPYSELIFDDGEVMLSKVPSGRKGTSILTGFSLYSNYGITIHPAFDHYVYGLQQVGMEEVFVHSLLSTENKLDRTHCALFYALNSTKMNLMKVRELVRRFKLESIWFELQNYVRGLTYRQDLFLPRKEFEERATLYGIDAKKLLPPPAHPTFFESLGEAVNSKVRAFLFGGEDMRIKGLKQATKDVDLAVEQKRSFILVRNALEKMGYKALGPEEMSEVDKRLEPSGIFVKEGYPRVDIFTGLICNKFKLSSSMIQRSDEKTFGKLGLYLMCKEDLFLLKAVTGREADDVDMVTLVKGGDFDWKVVVQELYQQEKLRRQHFCHPVLDSVESVVGQLGIKISVSVYRELVNHVSDFAIVRVLQLKKKQMSITEIAKSIGDIKEYEVRRRLQELRRKKIIFAKLSRGRKAYGLSKNVRAFMRCEQIRF